MAITAVIKDDFDLLIAGAAEKWRVPFAWIKAICGAESEYNPLAFRAEPQINDGSYGLMQILLQTARGLGYIGTAAGLLDPATNIDLASKLLAQLRHSWGTDFRRVYSAYNSGGPDNYLTNPVVRAHVERAVSYLEAVEAGITYVYPVEPRPAPGGAGAADVGALVYIAILAAIVFSWKG